MRTATVSFRCLPVSLLLIAGLLSTTACSHHSSDHAYGDDAGTSNYDGMHSKHGKGRSAMHASRHGHPHAKGYGTHGRHAMHAGTHQDATPFIDHILTFKDGMSLTDEQVQRLRAMKTQYKKTRITMKADVRLASVDLHALMEDETASLSDIEAQLDTMHAAKTKLYMASITAKREARAVLSEEQQSRMDAIHTRITSQGDAMMHHDGHPRHRQHQEQPGRK